VEQHLRLQLLPPVQRRPPPVAQLRQLRAVPRLHLPVVQVPQHHPLQLRRRPHQVQGPRRLKTALEPHLRRAERVTIVKRVRKRGLEVSPSAFG
jgi:hypothetical protein